MELFLIFMLWLIPAVSLAFLVSWEDKALKNFDLLDNIFCFCPIVNTAMFLVVFLGGLVMCIMGGDRNQDSSSE